MRCQSVSAPKREFCMAILYGDFVWGFCMYGTWPRLLTAAASQGRLLRPLRGALRAVGGLRVRVRAGREGLVWRAGGGGGGGMR